MLVTMDFSRDESNVYNLVSISFDFLACCGGLAKYQACLIFHQPSTTLDPDRGSAHLETVLSLYALS